MAETFNMAASESRYFLIDLSPNIKELTGPGPIRNIVGVSPDRKKLLYEYDYKDYTRLAITDSSGKVINDFAAFFDGDYADYYSWLNNQTLRVVTIDIYDNEVKPISYFLEKRSYKSLSEKLLDFHANQIKDNFYLDWGIDTRAIQSLNFGGANIIYDPTLLRVAYPKNGQVVSLTDVETEQELASIQLPQWGRLPRWSDDGGHLVLIASTDPNAAPGHDEFFIVSRDGPEFKRLTYLTNQFEKVHISEYAWSPDGKRIAFWLNTTADDPMLEGTQSELAVLDIESGEITRLCIEGISAPMRHEIQMTHTQPVWSPNGSQIAFAQLDSSRANTYNVLVVDLETQIAFKVATNKEPIGWMVKEP